MNYQLLREQYEATKLDARIQYNVGNIVDMIATIDLDIRDQVVDELSFLLRDEEQDLLSEVYRELENPVENYATRWFLPSLDDQAYFKDVAYWEWSGRKGMWHYLDGRAEYSDFTPASFDDWIEVFERPELPASKPAKKKPSKKPTKKKAKK